jgi:hypothetical protein
MNATPKVSWYNHARVVSSIWTDGRCWMLTDESEGEAAIDTVNVVPKRRSRFRAGPKVKGTTSRPDAHARRAQQGREFEERLVTGVIEEQRQGE